MSAPLNDLLRRATADIEARPSFGPDVLAGARRRASRRRAGLAVVALGSVAALSLTATHVSAGKTLFATGDPTPQSSPISNTQGGPLSDGSTHGDLASDGSYLAQVQDAWRGWMSAQTYQIYDHPVGQAKVLWAGTTPAGPAALLEQVVDLPRRSHGASAGRHAALGYIGVGGVGPRVAWAHFDEDSRSSTAWYVDEAHTVIVVTDNAVRRGVSFGFRYHADGSATRDYTPLSFSDGAAVVTLPKDVRRNTVAVADLPWRSFKDDVSIENVELPGEPPLRGLGWTGPEGGYAYLPATDGDSANLDDVSQLRDLIDRGTELSYETASNGSWLLFGTTADGTKVRVTERQLDTDPARLYLSYGGVLSDEGISDKQAALPVQIHLPHGQGWLVAQNTATLRYRTGTGPWRGERTSAALLPEAATAVEVTLPGRPAQVVQLPRP